MKNNYTPILIAFLAFFMFFGQAHAHVGEPDMSTEVDRCVDEVETAVNLDGFTINVTVIQHPCGAMNNGSISIELIGTFVSTPTTDDYSYTIDGETPGNSSGSFDGTGPVTNPTIIINGLSAGDYSTIIVTATISLGGGAACPSAPASATLTALPQPNAMISSNPPNDEICFGESVIFTAMPNNPNYTFNFFLNASTNPNQSGSSNMYDPANLQDEDEIYVEIVDNNNGCSDISETITMTVNQNPVPEPQANPSTVCQGESLQLTVSESYMSYNWTDPQGFIISNAPNPSVTNPVDGTYSVTVTDMNQCSGSGSVDVTVSPTPTPPGLMPITVCDGESTAITPTPNDGDFIFYNDDPDQNSNAMLVSTGPSYSPDVPAGTSMTFWVTQIDGFCESTSESVLVTVNANPTISLSSSTPPTNPTTCGGTEGTISLSFTNVPDGFYTISYSYNGGTPSSNMDVSNGNTTISGLAAGTYANFSIIANNCVSTMSSASVTLTDPPTPTVSSNGSTNPSTCNGSDGTISLSFTNVPNGSYTISSSNGTFNNINVSNGSATIPGLSDGTYSNFSITVNGCVSTSSNASETLTDPPAPTISSNGSTNPTTCGGSDGTISLNFTNVPNGNYTISYTNGSFPNVNVSGGSATISEASAGTYSTFTITANGCESTSSVNITLTDPPPPTISSDGSTNPTTCGGTEGEINLSFMNVPNGNYTISSSNGSFPNVNVSGGSATISGVSAGTYSNFSITANGCEFTSTVSETLVDPALPTISVGTETNPLICGTSTGSIQLSFDNVPNGNYTITYDGGSFTNVNVSNGSASINNLSAGNYNNLTITANDCTSNNNADAMLVSPGAPDPTINSQNPNSCITANGSFVLNNLQALVTYEVSYTFNGNTVTSTEMSNTNGSITINGLAPGTYTNIIVRIGNSQDCASNPESATLSAPMAPTASLISNDPDNTLCNDESITFTASGGGGGAIYEFFVNGQSTQSSNGPAFTPSNIANGAQVSVEVTNSNDCSDTSESITVTVNQTNAPTGTSEQAFCQTQTATLADLAVTGTTIKWYASPNSPTPLGDGTALNDGTTYYATQTLNNCESDERLAVTVSVDTPPNAGTDGSTDACNDGSTINLNSLISGEDSGGLWTDTDNSGVSLNNTSQVSFSGISSGNYTFTYTLNGSGACAQETDQSTVEVTVSESVMSVSASPENQTICSSNDSANLMGSAILQSGQSSAVGAWVGGNGTFAPGRTSANATYTPQAGEAGETVILRWRVIDPCTDENSSSDPINVEVSAAIEQVTADVTNINDIVCSSQSVNLTANVELAGNGSGSGMWSGGAGEFEDANSGNTTYTLASGEVSGNLTLTWTPNAPASPCPVAAAESVSVQISPEISDVDAGDDILICSTNADGESNQVVVMGSVSLANDSDGSGMWSGGNGEFAANGNGGFNYTPSANDAGRTITLTWTANDPDGARPCMGNISDEIDVTINNGLTSINAGNDETACFGESVSLNSTATQSSGQTYLDGTWTGGNGEFGDENLDQTSYETGDGDEGAMVLLTWTSDDPDGSGPCVALSDGLSLVVNELPPTPTVSGAPEDYEICLGEDEDFPTLNVSVNNPDTETVDWFNVNMNGNVLNGGVGVTSFQPPSEGSYYAQARNTETGCTSENGAGRTEVAFVINDLPTAFFTQTGFLNPDIDIFFTDGSEPSNPEDCIVEWSWDFGTDASLGPLTVTEPYNGEIVQYSSAGDKEVVLEVTDKNGCVAEHSSTLPISNQTCGVIIGIVNGDNQACQGETISFTITDGQFSSGANAWARLDWTINGVLQENHSPTINVPFDTPGSYTIQLEAEDNSPSPSGHCIVPSNTIGITINPEPAGNLVVVTDAICTGEDAQVKFDLGGSNNTTFDIVFTTGLIENYNSGSVISFPTPPGPLDYNLLASTITDNQTGCTNDINSSGTIMVNSIPEIEVNQLCEVSNTTPLSIAVENGTTPFNVMLKVGEITEVVTTSENPYITADSYTNGTTYNISVVDANGCSSNIAMSTVDCDCVTEAGNINTTPISTCVGSPVTIIPPSDGMLDPDDVLNYKIEGNGVSLLLTSPIINFDDTLFIPGATYMITPVAGNDDGTGSVDEGHPCSSRGPSVSVIWHGLPTASISAQKDTICPGESLNLMIDFVGTFDNYDVEITEIKSDGTSSVLPNTQNIDINPFSYPVTPLDNSTTYIITELSYDAAFNCTQTNLDTVTIEWYDAPVIDDIVTEDTLKILTDITFTPNITFGSSNEINSYLWEFPSANVVLVTPPLNNFEETVRYEEAANQTVTLTITDGNGCSHTYMENVSISLSDCFAEFTLISDGDICVGEDILLNYDSGILSSPNVQWLFGETSNQPDGSTEENPPPVSYNSPGNKTITLSVQAGEASCTSSETITILETPIINLREIDETDICENHQIRYLADLGNTSADNFIWTLTQDDTIIKDTTMFPTINVNWGQSGTLSVVAGNGNNLDACTGTDMVSFDLSETAGTAVNIDFVELIMITRPGTTNDIVFVYPEKDLCYQWYKSTKSQVEQGQSSESAIVSGATEQYFRTSFDPEIEVVWVKVQREVDGSCDGCDNYVFSDNDSISTIGIIEFAAPQAEPGLALELYPNPNNGSFQLALKGDEIGRFQINIFDNLGRLLKQQVLEKEVPRNMIESIQLDNLTKGIYFLQVVDEQGEFYVIRFIVQGQY